MVGRNKLQAFKELKERLHKKMDKWSARLLSIGGRKVLIKSILQSIPIYAMSCFLLPNSLCKKMESVLARFWWQKKTGKKELHWCSWKALCSQKQNGDMGFKDLPKVSISLLAKQAWRLMETPTSLCENHSSKVLPQLDIFKGSVKVKFVINLVEHLEFSSTVGV